MICASLWPVGNIAVRWTACLLWDKRGELGAERWGELDGGRAAVGGCQHGRQRWSEGGWPCKRRRVLFPSLSRTNRSLHTCSVDLGRPQSVCAANTCAGFLLRATREWPLPLCLLAFDECPARSLNGTPHTRLIFPGRCLHACYPLLPPHPQRQVVSSGRVSFSRGSLPRRRKVIGGSGMNAAQLWMHRLGFSRRSDCLGYPVSSFAFPV